MDTVWKLFGVGIVSAILCATVRTIQKPYALGLTLASVLLIGMLGIRLLEPVVRSVQALRGKTKLDSAVFSPLLRICGIGLLTDVSCAFCCEAGEQSICRLLEFGGCAAALCALLPLLDGMLEIIRPYIGG